MSLYVYQKAVPPSPPPPSDQNTKVAVFTPHHFLPLVISFVGMALIGFVVWPILSYELTSRSLSTKTTSGLFNPLVEVSDTTVYAAAPSVVNQVDYTKASNWFPTAALSTNSSASQTPTLYTLSVPKLKIENAIVNTNTLDLSKSLIHYPDTALPGQLGSPVVFGHSILPQFYNPKNYTAIFSLLPNLEKGDQIIVTYDKVEYTYTVSEKKEVDPTDLSPLEQRYDQKRLKLITCVPPGLKTRRLVVTALLTRS